MIHFISSLESYIPKNEYSEFIKFYFADIIDNGVSEYISNLDVETRILEVNGVLIPISLGNLHQDNCYTGSLSGYFHYLFVELKKVENGFIRFSIEILSRCILLLIKKNKADSIVFVNNLLLSTNLYPNLSKADMVEIHDFLIELYPESPIFYRSMNDVNSSPIEFLEYLDYKKIVSRQIFVTNQNELENCLMKRDSINDRKLLSKTSYFIETRRDYSFQELQEIKACYDNLYISKYTDLNPRFTIKYLDLIQKNPYFRVNVLRNVQEIKAVFAYYCINETITTPIFGYKNENLYRHISYLLLDQSLLHKKTLNQSSGAGQFKLNRGARKYMEYSLVYYKHISFGKRVVWNILYFFSRKFGENLLKNNIY